MKEKFRVFVPGITYKQLEVAEMAMDYHSMSKKLLQLIFAKELEEKPDKICCTYSEGKELLDQEVLKGIRCKCNVMYVVHELSTNAP